MQPRLRSLPGRSPRVLEETLRWHGMRAQELVRAPALATAVEATGSAVISARRSAETAEHQLERVPHRS